MSSVVGLISFIVFGVVIVIAGIAYGIGYNDGFKKASGHDIDLD